jgi:ADP-ribose pyrophosphatase
MWLSPLTASFKNYSGKNSYVVRCIGWYDRSMRNIVPKNAKFVPKQAELAFKGVIFDVYQWQQEMFDGTFETFEMIKRPDTIKVLAIKDDKIIILEQEQPGDEVFYDIPGGRHDVESEDELDAAKREMLEETGITFKNWKLLSVVQPHPKIEQFVYLFLATGFESQVGQNLDAGEKIDVHYFDFAAVQQLIKNSKARSLPKQLLVSVSSLDELVQLPEYSEAE